MRVSNYTAARAKPAFNAVKGEASRLPPFGNPHRERFLPGSEQLPFGFTLVEILIVMVIISIVASAAVLAITHNQGKNAEEFTHQLVNLITLSEEEALLRPATLGIGLTPQTLQFYQYQKKWIALTDKIFGRRPLPDNIKLSLMIENKPVPLDGKPRLIISSSGDISPFIILIGKKNQQPLYHIVGEANGRVVSGEIDADQK